MSHQQPRSGEQNVELGCAYTVEESGLWQEIQETLRRLLQHVISAILLGLRLYMLPLLYLVHKLSPRGDHWGLTTWGLVLGFSRHSTSGKNQNVNLALLAALKALRTGLATPFRIARTLYTGEKIIEENPEALQHDPASELDMADSAIDGQNVSPACTDNDSDDKLAKHHSETSASASQIYHAALVNGTTLDDILAAFEASDSRTSSTHDETPNTPVHRRHRYRTSSIQTTPERMTLSTRTVTGVPLPERDPNPTTESGPKTSRCPASQASPEETQKSHESPLVQICSVRSEPYHGHCRVNGKENLESKQLAPRNKRCATYVRRHEQSRLPKRSLNGERQQRRMHKSDGQISVTTAASDSPMKRPKLPPKVKVYQD